MLTIAGPRFDVIDISEGGIRIVNPGNIRLAGGVKGRLELLSGKRIDVEGRIEWCKRHAVGLLLRHPIPAALMQSELRHAILKGY